MANLTLAVEETILAKARVRALHQGTSVNAVVREYLAFYAGEATPPGLTFAELTREFESSSGARGRQWSRDDAHGR